MDDALDEVIDATAPLPRTPLSFGANLMLAHEGWLEGVPLDALELYVDALAEVGVDHVDINVGQFPWLDAGSPRGDRAIAKYDAVVRRIRDAGLGLVLNPQYGSTYHSQPDLPGWTEAALAFYPEVARRYEPEILVVVHEPTTMAARLGRAVSVGEWSDFARRTARAVREASPRTRIGAGGLAHEILHFRAFAALPEVEVLTLDIYDLAALPVYSEMVAIAAARGKPVYIEETWRTPFAELGPGDSLEVYASTGVGDEDFQELDARWLRALVQYAGAAGLEAFTPSWTQPFFKYVPAGEGDALDPAYTLEVIAALRNRERTPTFWAFRDLVAQYGVARAEDVRSRR
jgi:hypothetical protein